MAERTFGDDTDAAKEDQEERRSSLPHAGSGIPITPCGRADASFVSSSVMTSMSSRVVRETEQEEEEEEEAAEIPVDKTGMAPQTTSTRSPWRFRARTIDRLYVPLPLKRGGRNSIVTKMTPGDVILGQKANH